MKKLRLDLEAIEVDSFDTVAKRPAANGTVEGFDSTVAVTDCMDCSNAANCADSGAGGYTCGGGMTCVTNHDSCWKTCRTCQVGGVGCNNTAYPCQSYNACYTDVDTCNSAGYRPGC